MRYIFRRYLELETVRALRDDLAAVGVVSKRRMAADGSPYGGQRFSCGALYLMLKNRIYRGEIVHKGKAFPGEHAAIVDEDLWRRVQSRLEENRMERREGDKGLEPSLLAGIVFDASSEPMTPTHAVKKGTRYRYYISRRLITGPASDNSRGQRVPASNLEALVIGRLRALGRSRRIPECDLEWGTRCADAEEDEGRGGCAICSVGEFADRDAIRFCPLHPCQGTGARGSH